MVAVRVTEQVVIATTARATLGSNRVSHRQNVRRAPALIVFKELYDEDFGEPSNASRMSLTTLTPYERCATAARRVCRLELTGASVTWPGLASSRSIG